jgi:hypothetical protein
MVDPVKTTEILENPPFLGLSTQTESLPKTGHLRRKDRARAEPAPARLTTGCPQAAARRCAARNS